MQKEIKNWFSNWFDSEYYHILYKDRDHEEAQKFMDALTRFLNLPESGSILDLACGKGRHSVYLNKLGYHVTGADLSANSIAYATQFENESLQFKVHDMCEPFGKTFDAVFNLFTSFGYFENEDDNLRTLKAIKQNLNDTGFAVIDFMNVDYVLKHLVAKETKTVNNIDFHIKRYVLDGYIYKEIAFTQNGENFKFVEKVKALTLTDFENYFEAAGIYLLAIFGDYSLNKFNASDSERLIMIFK
jgi:SAM-dependent methyltransferase